jgi:hypothetical protein
MYIEKIGTAVGSYTTREGAESSLMRMSRRKLPLEGTKKTVMRISRR